jgi:hypothetical protein
MKTISEGSILPLYAVVEKTEEKQQRRLHRGGGSGLTWAVFRSEEYTDGDGSVTAVLPEPLQGIYGEWFPTASYTLISVMSWRSTTGAKPAKLYGDLASRAAEISKTIRLKPYVIAQPRLSNQTEAVLAFIQYCMLSLLRQIPLRFRYPWCAKRPYPGDDTAFTSFARW